MGQLDQLPIATADKKQQEEMIKLVDQLLKLNEDIKSATLQSKIDQIQSRIDYCEQGINQIVYQLYGLTQEEIAMVENA